MISLRETQWLTLLPRNKKVEGLIPGVGPSLLSLTRTFGWLAKSHKWECNCGPLINWVEPGHFCPCESRDGCQHSCHPECRISGDRKWMAGFMACQYDLLKNSNGVETVIGRESPGTCRWGLIHTKDPLGPRLPRPFESWWMSPPTPPKEKPRSSLLTLGHDRPCAAETNATTPPLTCLGKKFENAQWRQPCTLNRPVWSPGIPWQPGFKRPSSNLILLLN